MWVSAASIGDCTQRLGGLRVAVLTGLAAAAAFGGKADIRVAMTEYPSGDYGHFFVELKRRQIYYCTALVYA